MDLGIERRVISGIYYNTAFVYAYLVFFFFFFNFSVSLINGVGDGCMYKENNNSVYYNIPACTSCISAINTSWFLIIIDLGSKLRSDSVRLEFLRSGAVVAVYISSIRFDIHIIERVDCVRCPLRSLK